MHVNVGRVREYAGGSDKFGILSAEEHDAVKRYITQWQLLDQEEHVQTVRAWLARNNYID